MVTFDKWKGKFDTQCIGLDLRNLGYLFSNQKIKLILTFQKQAVITLKEKNDADKRFIKIWRPISLLNVDPKIISKVLATRLKNGFLI